jgi:hypothetical protein|tara:strand:- start:386 stop:502 length:117 start_codon:yes stop_codon:yes gene_type:complete
VLLRKARKNPKNGAVGSKDKDSFVGPDLKRDWSGPRLK